LKSAYLRASCTKSIVPIKLCIGIYLTRLLFFKTLRRLGAIFETAYILIRESKNLYLLLRKLPARKSVRFGIVKVHIRRSAER
jgi:hypothetical protein